MIGRRRFRDSEAPSPSPACCVQALRLVAREDEMTRLHEEGARQDEKQRREARATGLQQSAVRRIAHRGLARGSSTFALSTNIFILRSLPRGCAPAQSIAATTTPARQQWHQLLGSRCRAAQTAKFSVSVASQQQRKCALLRAWSVSRRLDPARRSQKIWLRCGATRAMRQRIRDTP